MQSFWLKSFRPPFKYLFVFAHMRSGSTLLTHILNSNPEIVGYGETKVEYLKHDSLNNLLKKNAEFFGKNRLSETFVMDKIVHDELFVDLSILKRPDVHCIFLLREPGRSVSSITKMYREILPNLLNGFVGGETDALEYYRRRLDKMSHLAEATENSQHCYFITFDQLIEKTEIVFAELKNFLEVQHEFSETYDLHRGTGVPGTGDYSQSIKQGKIIREKDGALESLAPEIIELALAYYDTASTRLKAACRHLD
ncbi:MAG: hypothetical protein IAF58_14305 [Leptolyngbya sp.]|nr:hypothetical protein [Candidatus Melainabacteria bacterium]